MAAGLSVALPCAPRPFPGLHSYSRIGSSSSSSIASIRVAAQSNSLRIRTLVSVPRASSPSATSAASNESSQEEEAPKKKRLRKMLHYLAQRPVPRRPNYILWASGAIFAVVMRKVIMQELQKWPGFFLELWEFLKALGMLVAKVLAEYAKEPTVWTVTLLGWAGLFLLDVYTFIVEVTPVKGLLNTIALSTAVLSLGEAARINAAANQPWILGLAAAAGIGAFAGAWDFAILSGMLGVLSIISYIRNRDLVTALLPAAATLVAVGVPKVQAGSFMVYLLLALYRNWSAPESREKVEAVKWSSPPIFVVFAIAIGINVAVHWLHARHLIWLAT